LSARPLDTVYAFETPEGVDLGLRIAGPVPRALAWLIDGVIRYAVLAGLSLAIARLAGFGVGLFLVMLFLMEWLYPVYFEVSRGATPGKKALGLLVVHDNGTPVGVPASLIRNLLRVVDFFPALYATGLACVLINRRFKRLGDLAAGTLVIYADRAQQAAALPIVDPRPLPAGVSTDEQRALLDFAERSATLASARAEELAELLTGEHGSRAVQRAHGYANWLARGR
jgi:uncharacterized RDD family membrane protein YckC